jgi:hypothetical protein
MAKLVKLEQKTFEGKPSGFKITLDDNRTGNLQEKESDKGLREGDEVFVTEIPYTSKAGKTSTLYGLRLNKNPSQSQSATQTLTIPQQATANKPSVAASSVATLKANATIKAMEYIVDCFIADKMTFEQIQAKHKELSGYLYDAIDDINQ